MSSLIGAYGSNDRASPLVNRFAATSGRGNPPGIISNGNFLGEGLSSIAIDDPSRFRPTGYVLPRQIELMNGFFNISGEPSTTFEETTSTTSSMFLQAPNPLASHGRW